MAKRALLVGCNYPRTEAELRGCVNDVKSMLGVLTEVYKYDPSNIVVLTDTDKSTPQPTGANIKEELRKLVAATKDGDTLFFHFSGHGTQVPTDDPDEPDGLDEAIVPCDLNLVLDDDLRDILAKLPAGAKFTMVADCCHSGSLLDGDEVAIGGRKDGKADGPDLGALGAIFGLSRDFDPTVIDGDHIRNRSLPIDKVTQMLSSLLGQVVDNQNIKAALAGVFGPDASGKYVAWVQQILKSGAVTSALGKVGPMVESFLKGGALKNAADKGFSFGGKEVDLNTLMQLGQAVMAAHNAASGGAGGGGGGASMVTGMLSQMGINPGIAGLAGNVMGQFLGGGGGGGPAPGGEPSFTPTAVKPPTAEKVPGDRGMLITGCRDKETSADACPSGDPAQAYGALTNALVSIIRAQHQQRPGELLSAKDLVTNVRELLLRGGFAQNPQLECSLEVAERQFAVPLAA